MDANRSRRGTYLGLIFVSGLLFVGAFFGISAWAAMGYEVVKSLGIRRLNALVGPSMGGMTSLAYAAMFPGTYRRIILISTGARSLPFSTAFCIKK